MTNPVGRPPKFETPKAMLDAYNEYESNLAQGEIPDVEGFCVYADSYRDMFSTYEAKEEFSDTVKKIKNRIYAKKKQLAMQNKMNPTIFIFDAKNNFGYKDKTEVDNNINGDVRFVNDVPRPNRSKSS